MSEHPSKEKQRYMPKAKESEARELQPSDNAADGEPDKIATVVAQVIEQKFSGPIPPPGIIAKYEGILPGSADRILRMAEQQSTHRQRLELMEMKAVSRDSLLGILSAFVLGGVCIAAGIFIVYQVPESAGAVCGSLLGATGIGFIAATFLKNTRRPDN